MPTYHFNGYLFHLPHRSAIDAVRRMRQDSDVAIEPILNDSDDSNLNSIYKFKKMIENPTSQKLRTISRPNYDSIRTMKKSNFDETVNHQCIRCGQSTELVCSKCGKFYCSVDCQNAHWHLHKPICFNRIK